jgi:xanthine dehydrogenase YagR molybdenum-binding subunit
MEFSAPAGDTLFDKATILGKPTPRIDGPMKTTGTAPYAHDRHDAAPDQAYGYIVGSAIAKGRLIDLDLRDAEAAPGVLAVVTAANSQKLDLGDNNTAPLLGGPEIVHYHQAIALVVAESFEQARAAAGLIRARYDRGKGRFDLAAAADAAEPVSNDDGPAIDTLGDFDAAFAAAPVTIDQHYHVPGESHAMMEPFATIASWQGDSLTVWTSNQMIAWGKRDLAKTLRMPPEKVRMDSPYIGGGFGGKLFLRADVLLAALGAKAAGRPVRIAMQRPLMINNGTHRPATLQHVRLAAGRDGKLLAIGHESVSGNQPDGEPETATAQSRFLYGAANRRTLMRLAEMDLPEGNAMRAPGEAPGHMALEVAMDELAEKLGMDPVELRVVNDTQDVPEKEGEPAKTFSDRNLVRCLREGAERFGWSKRQAKPAQVREGRWLIGMGMAAGFRDAPTMTSAARVTLQADGRIVVETDMTDIGTGSYTIIAQTAAEMMGVAVDEVTVRLGDSDSPVSAGSGGQWGAASATAGVYAACVSLRKMVADTFGMDADDADFAKGRVRAGGKSEKLSAAAPLIAEEEMAFGDFKDAYQVSSFAGHFCEVAVDVYTGEVQVRRMLAVCDAGRILNPVSARSQVIGAMVMAAGAALMEELAVDTRFGFFVNHDLAGYEVPVHADIPHQEVVFLDTLDPVVAPLKAKGVGELGICGVAAAVANAVYNATGARVREYPITVDKYIDRLPALPSA